MHIIIPQLFAAAMDDLIKLALMCVFILFWVLRQVADAKKGAKAQRKSQPAVQKAGDGEPAQVPAAAGNPLRAQVDAFLRRASGQGPDVAAAGAAGAVTQQPRPATPDRDSIEILLGNDPDSANRPPLSQPMPPAVGRRPGPPPVPPSPPRPPRPARSTQRTYAPRGKSVADHVAENVTSAVEQIRSEVSHLGDRVAAADRQFNEKLQQKFDHEIGTLGDRHAERVQDQQPAAAIVNPAVTIANLLASADGLQQAVVLNEVLRRPEERW